MFGHMSFDVYDLFFKTKVSPDFSVSRQPLVYAKHVGLGDGDDPFATKHEHVQVCVHP